MQALTIHRPHFHWNNAFTYLVLVAGLIGVAYPFMYIIMNSFKPGTEIMNSPNALPTHWVLDGYKLMWSQVNLPRLFANSLFLGIIVTLLNLILDGMAAYALAKIQFPGRDKLFAIMLVTLMIPGVLFTIPSYVFMYHIGWVGSFKPLIIPAAASVFSIFLLRQFMFQIPNELVESARMDGCNEFSIFLRIILPMSLPALTTVAILTFMGSWNDFFGPLLYLNKAELWTVQIGLYQFQTSISGANQEQIYAMMAIITTPMVLVYFFLQDQFMTAFANVRLK